MKKILFGLMACAALCACTSDDVLSVDNQQGYTTGEGVAYLTVRIKDVNSGTRATDGGFAYGTAAEQGVRNAYFYLYDDNGDYVAYGSLGDVSGTANDADPATNIDWESDTQVAIWGLTDPSVPKKMVTVLNQPNDFNGVNKSLDEMTAALAGTPYRNSNLNTARGNLVMSTSVYSGTDGVVNYTALDADDFALEPVNLTGDYPNGGVDVYVERLAAKVSVVDAASTDGYITDLTAVESNFQSEWNDNYGIQLLGYDVDAVARDAYVVKNIADDNSWSDLTFVWNAADNHRSYWGESPNYGDQSTVYPTSSNGNTSTDENNSSTQLNEYLRYVDLRSPVALDEATYCGENTNTTDVLGDASNTGITNLLVKAQFGVVGDEGLEPVDLVEYHGEYYTAADFCQKTVEDVVAYDFTVVVDEVIEALKNNENFSSVSGYLDDLDAAIIRDHIYVSEGTSHKFGTGVSAPESVSYFGGGMLSLYNAYDGNVKIYYNMTTQPQWGNDTDGYTNIDPTLAAKYPASDIVYGGADLNNYDFWFHIDSAELGGLEAMGLTALGLLYQIPSGSGDYFMPIDNSISFTTLATGDDSYSGGHVYTTRNFLLRTITVEADGIDSEFGSLYPNYYAGGLMYYHVPIEHLGSSDSNPFVEGQYGVVRNHWYNVTINEVANLGRGIAVENEVIVPQPEVDYYYLGADIDILSWKMIDQQVSW